MNPTSVTSKAQREPNFVLSLMILALTLVVGSSPLRADLVLSIENVQGPTAGIGSFDVVLTNDNAVGGTSYDVGSFSFQVDVPALSGVTFTGATTSVTNYIFQGVGGEAYDPASFFFVSTPTPDTSLIASDTDFLSPGPFPAITVGPGSSFGLGVVTYSVSSTAPGGTVPISFGDLGGGTSLTDSEGAALDFRVKGGSIQVSGAIVPEPSSLVLTLGAFACGLTLVALKRRRFRTRRGPASAVTPSG